MKQKRLIAICWILLFCFVPACGSWIPTATDPDLLDLPLKPIVSANWTNDSQRVFLTQSKRIPEAHFETKFGFYDWKNNSLEMLDIPEMKDVAIAWADLSNNEEWLVYSVSSIQDVYPAYELFVYDIRHATNLDLGVNGRLPTISPDGKKVVYWNERDSGIYSFIYDIASKRQDPLFEYSFDSDNPRNWWVEGSDWSPDGLKMAYSIYSDTSQGYISSIIGIWDFRENKRVELIKLDKKGISQPVWSPDSRYIEYYTIIPTEEFWTISIFDTQQKCVVGNYPIQKIKLELMKWMPNGESFAVISPLDKMFFIDIGKNFGGPYNQSTCPVQ